MKNQNIYCKFYNEAHFYSSQSKNIPIKFLTTKTLSFVKNVSPNIMKRAIN